MILRIVGRMLGILLGGALVIASHGAFNGLRNFKFDFASLDP